MSTARRGVTSRTSPGAPPRTGESTFDGGTFPSSCQCLLDLLVHSSHRPCVKRLSSVSDDFPLTPPFFPSTPGSASVVWYSMTSRLPVQVPRVTPQLSRRVPCKNQRWRIPCPTMIVDHPPPVPITSVSGMPRVLSGRCLTGSGLAPIPSPPLWDCPVSRNDTLFGRGLSLEDRGTFEVAENGRN